MTELIKPSTEIDDYACFVALDFHKAFDSVRHDYLNELLAHINCGHRARNFLWQLLLNKLRRLQLIIVWGRVCVKSWYDRVTLSLHSCLSSA